MRLSTVFYHYFKRILGGGLSSPQMDTFNSTFFNMRFFEEIWAKYSQTLPYWSKYNADSQIDTKPGPTDKLLQTKPKSYRVNPDFYSPTPTQSTFFKPPPPLPDEKTYTPPHLERV